MEVVAWAQEKNQKAKFNCDLGWAGRPWTRVESSGLQWWGGGPDHGRWGAEGWDSLFPAWVCCPPQARVRGCSQAPGLVYVEGSGERLSPCLTCSENQEIFPLKHACLWNK